MITLEVVLKLEHVVAVHTLELLCRLLGNSYTFQEALPCINCGYTHLDLCVVVEVVIDFDYFT